MELESGTVLLGKYRVDEVLGVGGMGKVVRASHLYLQQSVAIKILLPQMVENESTVARFLREAQATVNLKSEHIARMIDVGTMPDGTPFMVMEYLEGNDLNQILRHHGPQPPSVVCDLMLQACEGLAEAHAMGIVHRDIKPSNFFITKRADGTMLLKILDFGISKTPVGVTELTGSQNVIGTPTYMAPEQMKSGKGAEPRSDIWSIGIVMYQLLTGRPPFVGESYADLVLRVNGEPAEPIMVPLPAGLNEVILRCLEKQPNLRPQNAGELARSLAPFASEPAAAAQSASRATRTLQHRMSQQGMQGLPTAAQGGRAAPMPSRITPSALAARSWPPSQTSVSGGSGQVTHQVRGGRGWMIAGVSALCILAGAGGFVANEIISDDDPPRPAAASATAPPAAPAPAAPGATSPPATTPTPRAAAIDPHATTAATATTHATQEIAAANAKPATSTTNATPAAQAEPTKPAPKVIVIRGDGKAEEPAPPKPATDPFDRKPSSTLVVKSAAKPATDPFDRKPSATLVVKSAAKPAATKPRPKPRSKSGDLFDNRK